MRVVVVILAVAILVLAVKLWDRPRVDGAVLCALLSALWWPANNKVLEGPVLLRVTTSHGFTTADLLGVFGVFSSVMAVRRARYSPVSRREALVAVSFIALLGATTAYITG